MKHTKLLISYISIVLLLTACRLPGDSPKDVNFSELISNPSEYNGTNICTDGFYLSGFEASSLGAGIYELGGSVYLTEPAIWVEGIEINDLGECQISQGYSFCQTKVCGHFEYGRQYGHLGGYEYQIISSKVNP